MYKLLNLSYVIENYNFEGILYSNTYQFAVISNVLVGFFIYFNL